MASVMNNDDLVEVTFINRARDQNGLMVMHFHCENKVGTGGTDQLLADELDEQVGPLLIDLLSAEASYEGVKVQIIKPIRRDATFAVNFADVGAVEGDLFSTQAAGLLSMRTGVAGKTGRGRKYVPFASEADNTVDGVPSVSYATRLNTLAVELEETRVIASGGNSTTVVPVVYSRTYDEIAQITGHFVRQFWATQRRRSLINRADTRLVP